MSRLYHPKAIALLEDARVDAADVRLCQKELTGFVQRYLPAFYREELRELATLVIQGKLSDLQRKTCEPIANEAGHPRRGVQRFVGAGKWNDGIVLAELRRHVREELGDPQGTMILDASAFAKKGSESCGVARQWCGRLGKVENCQVGVFLGYASTAGQALLDCQLYLPLECANDRAQRKKCHVPNDVTFKEKWRMGLDLLDRSGPDVPHRWVVGDDEFGRVTEFRAALRLRHEHYVLDVPGNTLVRELTGPDGPRPPFERIDNWAARQLSSRWQTLEIRAGEKGLLKVRAITALVQTKEEGKVGPAERALVIRSLDREPFIHFALSNDLQASLRELAATQSQRHRIEELFQAGKGEVGLSHYEVRSWTGWHHHMTLSLLTLWFLCLAKKRLGKKNPGHHRAAAPGNLFAAPASPAHTTTDRQGDHPCAPANRRSTHILLAGDDRHVSATPRPHSVAQMAQ